MVPASAGCYHRFMKLSRLGVLSAVVLIGSTFAGGLAGNRVLAGGGSLNEELRLYTAMLAAIERDYVEEVPSDRLVSTSIRRAAPHAGPALELLRAEGLPDDAGAAEGPVLRPRHQRPVDRREHHRRGALRGDAGAPARHPGRRRHQPHRGRGRPGHEHRRRGQASPRPQGHPGPDHDRARRLRGAPRVHGHPRRHPAPLRALLVHGEPERGLHPADRLQRDDGLPSRRGRGLRAGAGARAEEAPGAGGAAPSSSTSGTTPAASWTRPSRCRTSS